VSCPNKALAARKAAFVASRDGVRDGCRVARIDGAGRERSHQNG
jgi:hypothetical protein